MNSLYFQVQNGCAGDMLVGSLLDLGLSLSVLEKELKKLPLPGYRLKTEKVTRETDFGHQLTGTIFQVIPESPEEETTSYKEILSLIKESSLKSKQKKLLKKIVDTLAVAESAVHGEKLEEVHFHQVGQMDALIEMTSVIIALDLLEVERVGCSTVGIAQPAPATIKMLQGIPVTVHPVPYELATPTGVAILRAICSLPGQTLEMCLKAAGYGAGLRKQPSPNMVQVLLGSTEPAEKIVGVIETNIDDMNPVMFDQLMEKLFEAGALDVSFFPGQTKKNRPVFNLRVIVPEAKMERVAEIIFTESTTLGLRFHRENRLALERRIESVATPWGKIPVKLGFWKQQLVNMAPEYDACKAIAKKFGLSLKKVYAWVAISLGKRLKIS
ncbi:MAG: nickel pincer cofactor biosynthesis protein LarC [Candidatus Omnitrophica bacterium]|nr:nickel pincer cofactor biosynthesis protein LarC [Candidatus Omnitrophota bacterium]